MFAVNTSRSRTVGQTSVDSAATFFFGKRTFTARGFTGFADWLATGAVGHYRDRLPRYPLASGHGHRP